MLTLRSGASSLVVAPEYGAGITGWMVGRTPILRRALPQASVGGDPHAMGCFLLLPYGNRLAGARFHWLGTDYTVTRNFGDQPHAIHGIGWRRAWSVTASAPDAVTLGLDHQPDRSWPFAFQAVVTYALSDAGLEVTLGLTNRHTAPAPAALGLHPFFPKAADSTLRFEATGVWRTGSNGLPLNHGSPPLDWRHDAPRRVMETGLDNCFTGWSGTADIQAGSVKIRIEASGVFRHLQVFTPSWADFFCAEPVSHVPDALNRAGLPVGQAMHVLLPGESVLGTIRFFSQAGGGEVPAPPRVLPGSPPGALDPPGTAGRASRGP